MTALTKQNAKANIEMLHCLLCEMRNVLFTGLLCLDNQDSAACVADDLFR